MARSRAAVAGVALAVLVTLSGCGFAEALAHPEAQRAAQQAADAGPTPVPAAAPSTAAGPRLVARAALLARGEQVGTVQVSVAPVVTGLVPPAPEFPLDCPVSGPSLQYVAVDLAFDLGGDGGPAGHLTATPGPGTPSDIGDLGVFFHRSPDDGDPYCADYPPLPATDTFWGRGTTEITGWVVLDQAVGPATPQGRAEVFPTLQLRLDHLRIRTESGRETPLTVGALSVGAACPDDAGAICVPAG